MATFTKLHEGTECKCLELGEISENHADTFTRLSFTAEITEETFYSHHERKPKYKKPFRDCNETCMWRGVSINKYLKNREAIKTAYHSIRYIAPQGKIPDKFVCSFRLVGEAGKVWDTSKNKPELHHTFLKCDAYKFKDCIQIVALCPLREF